MLFLGIIGAAGIFAGTNPAYTPHELVHHIRTSKTKFLITEPEMLDNILVAASDCSIPKENIFIFNVLGQAIPPGFRSWQELLQHREQDWVRFDSEDESKSTTSARLYSSGTSGLPKAAMISHYNLVAQHTLVHEINERAKDYEVSSSFSDQVTRSNWTRFADYTYSLNSTWPLLLWFILRLSGVVL